MQIRALSPGYVYSVHDWRPALTLRCVPRTRISEQAGRPLVIEL